MRHHVHGTTPTRSCPGIPDRLADVVVIGAGALGAATAWWLARAGRTVVVLDERTPRQLQLAARGTAWSAHPAWTAADEVAPLAAGVAAWRDVERQTGAALLTRCDALDDGELLPGAGLQVRADHAVAALTAAAVGVGAVVRYRTPVTAVEVLDDQRVEVRTPAGRIRAHRAIVTSVDPAPVRGLELHFTSRRPLGAGTPLIAHHDPVLGIVRAAPCVQGHLAVGADTWPRGTLRDLRDHVRAWFPELDVERPEPVGPDAMSTAPARITLRHDGPVVTATSTALGSVGVVAHARRLAERVGVAVAVAETA